MSAASGLMLACAMLVSPLMDEGSSSERKLGHRLVSRPISAMADYGDAIFVFCILNIPVDSVQDPSLNRINNMYTILVDVCKQELAVLVAAT